MKSNFGGLPRGRKDGWEGGCEFIFIDLNLTYVVAKFELARYLVEKIGQAQRLCNCVNSQILEGYQCRDRRDGLEESCEFIFIDLNLTYVVAKLELLGILWK